MDVGVGADGLRGRKSSDKRLRLAPWDKDRGRDGSEIGAVERPAIGGGGAVWTTPCTTTRVPGVGVGNGRGAGTDGDPVTAGATIGGDGDISG